MTELDELVMAKIKGKPVTKTVDKEIQVQRKVVDTFNRNKLGEGRSYGLGFSILDKTDTEYKALMAFTACKDYLNDFVYVEGTGLALATAHGFTHKYTGKLKGQDYFYTGFRPVHNLGGSIYKKFDEVNQALNKNSSNIIKFINKLEKEFKLDNLTTLEAQVDDVLILKTPAFWSKFSFLYSMYGLFIRCFLDITNEELEKDIWSILKDRKTTIIDGDVSLLVSCQRFFPFKLENLLDYTYPINPNSYTIHNYGIVGRLQQMKK